MRRFRFPLALAWRESRSPRRLILLMASTTAGVAALVAIGSFTRNLQDSVREQARALLGADLVLGSAAPLSPLAESIVSQLRASGGAGAETGRVTSFAAMAYVPRTAGARPVQVMAIEGGFPFYGRIQTSPPAQWARLDEPGGILVEPSLLTIFDARVGDALSLGEARFEIRGTVVNYPGDIGIRSALGPRVFLPAADLPATGLLKFGSRARYEAFLKLPEGADAQRLADRARPRLASERVSIRTVAEDQRSLSNNLGRLGRYLSMVGLVALLLGGLGVASAVRALMKKKMDTIAVLRCLGATGSQIFSAYLLQAVGLGLVGSVLGALVGVGLQWTLPLLFRGMLPVDVSFAPVPSAIAAGLLLGAWVSGMFSLLPLLSIREVSALAVLRRDFEGIRGRRDPRRIAAAAALAASVVALSVAHAPNPGAGLLFAAFIGAALASLWGAAILLMKAVRRWFPTRWPYVWRQGLANLHRPANQTAMVVLALGFGAFLLDTVYVVHHNLLRDLRVDGREEKPNLALFDIQPDQREGLRALLAREGLTAPEAVPIVPMRIVSVKGTSAGSLLAQASVRSRPRPSGGEEGRVSPWTLRREYRSTYRDGMTSSERVVRGEGWAPGAWREPRADGAAVPISLEEGVADDLGVTVGDQITWDVQGVTVPTRVASLREVDWARFEPNFFVVFPEGPLDAAPQTFLTLTRVAEADRRARLQRAVAEAFPNVTALDLAQVQQVIETILARVTLAIRFMAFFSLAAGVVVLLGAVAASRDQRIREGVLLKTLGATRAQVVRVILAEYLSLGTLASLSAFVLSLIAGWALLRFLFESPFHPPLAPLLLLSAGVVVLTAAIGAWSARDVFARPPLEALRAE
ncbi:MAG TPA: FtsX-like permease family protein [Vicinamibacteria bacterium]|nr:FtsX-like permease family protein [Vicinamibacteria bacterium]